MYGLPSDYTPPITDIIEPTQPMVVVPIQTDQPVHSTPPINHNMIQVTKGVPVACSNEHLQMLEESLKVIEGSNYGMVEAANLCLVPDAIIPPKFKAPEFDNYKGTSCPKSQLTMYCRKMAAHTRDDKQLIHCFKDSLIGATLKWYMQLEQGHIRSWKDLGEAFILQYKYNIHLTPERFERLRKFKLRLNPAKCTFGVKSGKLLGFIVSQRGIKVDPDKVCANVAPSHGKGDLRFPGKVELYSPIYIPTNGDMRTYLQIVAQKSSFRVG